MGDASDMSRCQRFIDEFNELAKTTYPLPPRMTGLVQSYGLGYDERTHTVAMYWRVGDYTLLVDNLPIFFDPTADNAYSIEIVEDAFDDTPHEVLVAKLHSAGLIDD